MVYLNFSLQTIIFGTIDRLPDFIYQEIFPGSELPHLPEIIQAASPYFEIADLRKDGLDYERTCKEWLTRLKRNKIQAIEASSPDVYRKYEVFLRISERAFRISALDLARITFRKK